MTRNPRHSAKPRSTSLALAGVAVLMVLGAVAAVFIPLSNGDGATSLPIMPGLSPAPASLSPAATGTPSSSHPPTTSPAGCCPVRQPSPGSGVVPVAYPAPTKTYPAPNRTYPAPSRTYPAPTTSYPPPPPSPTPPPGSDLPPPMKLTAPMTGAATTDLAAWDAATHSTAQLMVRYVSMASPLSPTFIHSALRVANGATPVIEILLRDSASTSGQGITLESVASGSQDAWLSQLRDQITAMGHPVILSFAPEPNGAWYTWGQDPGGFITAYRHVHTVVGTNDVTWMWQPSASQSPPTTSTDDLGHYWPGASYVDWVGLDGYYYVPGDSFEHRFAHSLAELATWWTGPVIIAETAVSPDTKNMPNDVTDLFDGVTRHHLLGLIYFDLKPVCPPECGQFHPDFRLESYPPALAAYVKAVSTWPSP